MLSVQNLNHKDLIKTMREKEKLLVTSNFSFSLNVFLSIISINFPPFLTHLKLSFANFFNLSLYHTILTFNDPEKESF